MYIFLITIIYFYFIKIVFYLLGNVLLLFLLNIFFYDYSYILPYIFIFISVWFIFIKSNFMAVANKPLASDKVKSTNIIKKFHYSSIVRLLNICIFLIFINISTIYGVETTFIQCQLYISNLNLNILLIIAVFLLVLNYLFNTLISNNVNYSVDFFFSLTNIILVVILVFYVNTLYGLLFLLEINSVLILYKFVCSRYWYKEKRLIVKNTNDIKNRNLPKHYLSMLFFQYWSTFISSILLFISILNIYFIFGTTDFIILDILCYINTNIKYFNNDLFLLFVFLPFLLGFLVKLGFTPFHFFKIEVYKGLPLITLLFYTTFYFFVYFLFFVLLVCINISFLKFMISTIFYIAIFFGALYILSLIFDINSLKSFFAYSTIINSIMFLSLIVCF